MPNPIEGIYSPVDGIALFSMLPTPDKSTSSGFKEFYKLIYSIFKLR